MKISEWSDFSYEELQDRKGFYFISGVKSTETAIKNLCETMIKSGVTEEMPEKIFQNNNLTLFVYGDHSDFNMPLFFNKSQMAIQSGMCKVGCIRETKEFLDKKEEKKEQ